MPRPVKWSRDLYAIRERATRSKTETWGRTDIERLFNVGRASAQSLMKAIGEIQPVAGAHFVERPAVLAFLEAMIEAPSIDLALRERLLEAERPRRPRSLKVALPPDLRSAMVRDLPPYIRIAAGRLEIEASTVVELLESLALLARVLENDFVQVQDLIEPPAAPPQVEDADLQEFLAQLRSRTASPSQPPAPGAVSGPHVEFSEKD
jgi:hypothetical protein